jgi:hypothetical protein
MSFVTLKDLKNSHCIRLVHLRDRDWRPKDVPESLLKDVFEEWDFGNEAMDEAFIRALKEDAPTL